MAVHLSNGVKGTPFSMKSHHSQWCLTILKRSLTNEVWQMKCDKWSVTNQFSMKSHYTQMKSHHSQRGLTNEVSPFLLKSHHSQWSPTIFNDVSAFSMKSRHSQWSLIQRNLMNAQGIHSGRGGGLGARPKKMYGERLGDGVEYHLMKPTPRR